MPKVKKKEVLKKNVAVKKVKKDVKEDVKKFEKAGEKPKETKEIKQPEIEKKIEEPLKEVLWITLSFSDGTCWKFPAAMVIRKAQSVGVSIASTEKDGLIKFANEKMTWDDIRMKAIGIERDDAPDYNRDWKVSVKGVIYG